MLPWLLSPLIGFEGDLLHVPDNLVEVVSPEVSLQLRWELRLINSGVGDEHDNALAGSPEGADFRHAPAGFDGTLRCQEDAHVATVDRFPQLLTKQRSGSHVRRVPNLDAMCRQAGAQGREH